MAKVRLAEVVDFVKLLLTLRRPGWGYIAFAKLGLALVALGVSIVVPGVWETIVEAVTQTAVGDREDITLGVKLGIALGLGFLGIATIGLSFWLYHRAQPTGPSLVNEGAISTNVGPNTPLENLIRSMAEEKRMSVDLTRLSQSDRSALVATGVLRASNFEEFLIRVAERTNLPSPLRWTVSANHYKFFI